MCISWILINYIRCLKKIILKFVNQEMQAWRVLKIHDPFAKGIIDSELTNLQIQKREESWSIIEQYCLPHLEKIYQKKGREQKIKEIAQESRTSPTKIKRLFSRYWQRGMNKNALLPDYTNSGGGGITTNLTNEKVWFPT